MHLPGLDNPASLSGAFLDGVLKNPGRGTAAWPVAQHFFWICTPWRPGSIHGDRGRKRSRYAAMSGTDVLFGR
jgi:hypothetical protein